MHYEIYPKKKGYRSSDWGGVTPPKQFPCVELVHNYDWDDLGAHNWFSLWYFQDAQQCCYAGEVKIMTRKDRLTAEVLGDHFDGALDTSFCSLGITIDYYRKIYSIFHNESTIAEVMTELRDCAYDSHIYEDFCEDYEFKHSLLRELSAQTAQKMGMAFLHGLDPADAYSFSFGSDIKQPDDSVQQVRLNVNFPFESPIYKRTMCVIGENGMGKTQLLVDLTFSLINGVAESFDRMPVFSGCLVVCSTPLDSYPEQTGHEKIFYRNIPIEQRTVETADELAEAILVILTRPLVSSRSMADLYVQALKQHIGEITEKILILQNDPQSPWDDEDYMLDKDELRRVVQILSSGQLHLLSLITHIYAHIHFSTILIIDEPEVHLHPHTTVAFMQVLANILGRFRSFAIVATHSPLIVREVISANVQVLQKEENRLRLTPVAFNTFGEDITTLYYKIFEYDINDSFFVNLVLQKVRKGQSYEQIISQFDADVDLSLNARLTIRDLTEKAKKSNA